MLTGARCFPAAGFLLAPAARRAPTTAAAHAPVAELPDHADAPAPIPSPGCRLHPVRRTRYDGDRARERTLTSEGRTRRFLLVLPPNSKLDAGPRPLVLNFHGLMESP